MPQAPVLDTEPEPQHLESLQGSRKIVIFSSQDKLPGDTASSLLELCCEIHRRNLGLGLQQGAGLDLDSQVQGTAKS